MPHTGPLLAQHHFAMMLRWISLEASKVEWHRCGPVIDAERFKMSFEHGFKGKALNDQSLSWPQRPSVWPKLPSCY